MTFPSIQTDFTSHSTEFPIGLSTQATVALEIRPLKRKEERPAVPLPSLETTHVWGIDYSVVNMPQTLEFVDKAIQRREPLYAITANANYAMLCGESPRLTDFTKRCPLVLCDGMPVLWRSRLSQKPLPERVAGADLIYALAERGARRGHRIFLMGGADGVAQAAADRLQELYPRLIIAGVECPPFRQASVAEHEELCQRIRDAKPDILLVALGQPKGEFWIEENYQDLGVPLSIQLGASFDFIVGKAKRAPEWIQRIGMEWLFRTVSDPRRLLPRYAKNAWFLFQAIRGEILNATR